MIQRLQKLYGDFEVDGQTRRVELRTLAQVAEVFGVTEQHISHLARQIDEDTGDTKLNFTRLNIEYSKTSSMKTKQTLLILIDEKYHQCLTEREQRVREIEDRLRSKTKKLR